MNLSFTIKNLMPLADVVKISKKPHYIIFDITLNDGLRLSNEFTSEFLTKYPDSDKRVSDILQKNIKALKESRKNVQMYA